MSRSKLLSAVAGALFLMLAPSSAMADGPITGAPYPPGKPVDVPAPSVALLFAMGAAGVMWGRHLGNKRDKS